MFCIALGLLCIFCLFKTVISNGVFTKAVLQATYQKKLPYVFVFFFSCYFFVGFLFNILFSLLVHAHSILYPCWAASLTLAEWEKREQQTGTNVIMVKEA